MAQKNYNIKFSKEDFTFEKTEKGYKIKSKEGKFYFKTDTTMPALPYMNINILIPENSNIQNIKYNTSKSLLFDDIDIINNPKPHSTSERYVEIYRSNDFTGKKYPKENIKFISVNKIQNFFMASFTVCPFVYNNRELSLINSIDFSFDIITNKKRADNIKRYDAINLVGDLVFNPDELINLYPDIPGHRPVPEDIEYLIITSRDLVDEFKPLKGWKIKKGIRTEIISVEDIYAKYSGNSNQLKIKNCLFYYYKNRGLKWVLLGGDSNIIPVQYCHMYYENEYNNIPADLFYACYDNTFNWNADGDNIVGEYDNDNIDLSPEIFISRVPIRTSKHIKIFIDKTLNYEKYNTSYDYVNSMLLAGKELLSKGSDEYFSDAHEESENMYIEFIKPYWNGRKTKFYDTGTDFIQGANYDFIRGNLQDQLNRCYHFVHIHTHGGIQSYQMEYKDPSYNENDAAKLNNKSKSIVVTTACLTNAFDVAEPSLSEAMFRNPNGGCVLYWGGSREGWTGISIDYSEYFFYNVFRKNMPNDHYKFANITTISKLNRVSSCATSDSDLWIQFSQNAIGDPELSIYTDTPKEFSNATVNRSGGTITVNTGGISGCDIALTSIDYGKSYFKVYRNVSTATFTNSVFNNSGFNFHVTITKHNYKPFEYPKDIYIQNHTFSKDQYISAPNIYVGRSVTSLKPVGDVIINDNVKVTFAPGNKIKFDEGFIVRRNGSFKVEK
jgi:hypothetical protein